MTQIPFGISSDTTGVPIAVDFPMLIQIFDLLKTALKKGQSLPLPIAQIVRTAVSHATIWNIRMCTFIVPILLAGKQRQFNQSPITPFLAMDSANVPIYLMKARLGSG
ncbi:hypothetical protein CRM22_009665 [Opisthorchis felineus]|uniref:Uncharacterized protein n=1 Tax=Opisthorchis felineus TaxID=147828 RepID=A0A4S2L5S3_OPIFE|nr:hypothetical protein CRM22_009665 [Opisthorchis felineus]